MGRTGEVTTRPTWRPAVILWLASLAAAPWVWVLPFPFLFENAQWSDVLLLLAAIAWLWDERRHQSAFRIRVPHVAIAVYLASAAVSLIVSPARHRGLLLLLGMTGLAALFVLTAELTAEPAVRRALVRLLVVTAFLLGIASVVGLALFFGGYRTRLLGQYGDLVPSSRYARVAAGFENPNLLASYCTFASAIVSREDAGVPQKVRRSAQIVLCLVVVCTFSRAILGFLLAMALRAGNGARPRSQLLVALTVGIVAVLGVLTVANLAVDPGHLSEAHFSAEPSTRRQTLVASAHTLAEHPVFGKGLGSLPGGWNGSQGQAHFTALEIAATQGPIALVAIGVLVVTLWQRRKRPIDLATWSALAGMGVDSLWMDVHRFRHVWVLLGLADGSRAGDSA